VEKRILIVVCDRVVRELLVQTFADRGFRIVAASDGVSGLFQFGLAQPDLVVLDADGWETLKRIRALSTVPIIVLIEDDPQARIESLDQGADFFVTKPPSLRELEAKVRVLFRSLPKMMATAAIMD
jgi:DNA-binding response OmpR family regulator